MIDFRPGADRTTTRAEGRTTFHAFSFGAHYDPANTGFGPLVVLNEEVLPAGTGYAAHRHADQEVVTWVLEGRLRHESAVGEGVVGPGRVQRLRAGTGVEHAETAEGDGVRFLQAWLRPDAEDLEPGYAAADVAVASGAWTPVAGEGAAVDLAVAGAVLLAADLPAGDRLALPDAPRVLVHVVRGEVLLGERVLQPGDAARLHDEPGRVLRAEQDAHLVAWAFSAAG